MPGKQPVSILQLSAAPASHTNHSRSTSVVDGMVAMFPNDASNTVTPRSGVMVVPSMASSSSQLMTAQLQNQLQQHQLEQQLVSGPTGANNTNVLASANPSGIPSPYSATPSGPNIAGGVVSSHRRHLSSTVPGVLQQQLQQQQQPSQQKLAVSDTPSSLSTAQPTLVPGTPTSFGQLQFPVQQIN
ncbi:hypothetical protein GGI11_008905, partial [Coemansia sp. RSA 2049]